MPPIWVLPCCSAAHRHLQPTVLCGWATSRMFITACKAVNYRVILTQLVTFYSNFKGRRRRRCSILVVVVVVYASPALVAGV